MLAELTELIHAQHVIKSKVKTASVNFLEQRASFRSRTQIPSSIQLESWFYTDEMDFMIQSLVQTRPYFLENVGVFPVYCEEGLLHQIAKIPDFQAESILLEWYLEFQLEGVNPFMNIPIKNYTHLIIPLLINRHYRVAIVQIERNNGTKKATVQYYDSTGKDLEANYQEQLVNFFKKYGFAVNYECISQHEQKENHNCGIFIALKSIDIINQHLGNPERILNIEDLYGEDYAQFFNHYRYQIGKLLESNGIPVTMSQAILQKITDHSKMSFL